MPTPQRSELLVVMGLLLCAALGGAPAWAQLAVTPESVSVSVAQGETATQTVALTNEGSVPLSFCLNFDRPLQRTSGTARISGSALGGACGEYGEVLALIDEDDVPVVFWDPYGLAMTPGGRLFAAERFTIPITNTYELTPSLEFVRSFPHPVVEELDNSATTTGVSYDAATGTLWWLNIEGGGFEVIRALLVEGDLDGVATGRRIEIPVAEDAPPPAETGSPVGLAYDPVQRHFFFADGANDDFWAVDTLGNAVEGYPVISEAYPTAFLAGLDAHGGDAGLRLEVRATLPGATNPQRLLVIGAHGGDTAPGAEPLTTLLPPSNPNAPPGVPKGEPLRSRLDPNGVLYYPWGTFENAGVVAIRPHPLPPPWLVVEAWDGALGPGESIEIELTFRPGARAVGEYTAVLQAFEAENGAAVEVPLTLAVTQGTDAEDEAAVLEAPSLAVYPNPSSGTATVALTLTLAEATTVRVVVYDVLGREVAMLHDGPLAAGSHQWVLDGAALPSGVYVVRAEGEGFHTTQRVTLLR